MKQELKFRAIIKERNATVRFTLQDIVGPKAYFSVREILIPWLSAGNIASKVTGLTDKNEKEVYEGDFLKDEYNRILLVEWWQYAFTLKAITKTNFVRANYIIQWFLGVPFLPEIIGNIYENPELLEPKIEE